MAMQHNHPHYNTRELAVQGFAFPPLRMVGLSRSTSRPSTVLLEFLSRAPVILAMPLYHIFSVSRRAATSCSPDSALEGPLGSHVCRVQLGLRFHPDGRGAPFCSTHTSRRNRGV